MFVKIFDEAHEKDLEMRINDYLQNIPNEDVIDIKYQVAVTYDEREQIYCFSCLIILR